MQLNDNPDKSKLDAINSCVSDAAQRGMTLQDIENGYYDEVLLKEITQYRTSPGYP